MRYCVVMGQLYKKQYKLIFDPTNHTKQENKLGFHESLSKGPGAEMSRIEF